MEMYFSLSSNLLTFFVYVRAAKPLVRLRRCTGSLEPLLLAADAIVLFV